MTRINSRGIKFFYCLGKYNISFILNFSGALSKPEFSRKPPRNLYALNGSDVMISWGFKLKGYQPVVYFFEFYSRPNGIRVTHNFQKGVTKDAGQRFQFWEPCVFAIRGVSEAADAGKYRGVFQFEKETIVLMTDEGIDLQFVSEYSLYIYIFTKIIRHGNAFDFNTSKSLL